jgi:hypothetical protein
MASKMSEFGYIICATMYVLRFTAVRLRNFDVVFAPLCSLFVPYSYIDESKWYLGGTPVVGYKCPQSCCLNGS